MSGTVKQIISFEGQDNASKVANDVKKSMRGLADEAGRAGKETGKVADASGKAIDTVREKSGDVESALKGISDFAGGAKNQVSELGDSFGAVEAIMRLLPGPIGLVATGIAGAAIGAKLLSDYLSQTAAKANLLTNAAGGMLAERLDLGADAAVRLSQAFTDLGTKGVRPSDLLLRQIADNARALGQDPAENVAKFIAAWKDGPEAIRKVQAEIGKLPVAFESIENVAGKLGIDALETGLKAATVPAEQLKTALTEVSEREAEVAAIQLQIKANNEELVKSSVVRTSELFTQNRELAKQQATQETNLMLAKQQARDAAAQISATKLIADIDANRANQAQVADIRAQLAGSKEESQEIRLTTIKDQQKSIEEEIASIMRLQSVFGDGFLSDMLRRLQVSELQLEVQKKQIADADAAEAKAKASAAAAAARAKREADAAARLREADKAHEEWRKGIEAIKAEGERLRQQGVRETTATFALEQAKINGIEDQALKVELQAAELRKKAAFDIEQLQFDASLNRQARATETARIEIEAENAVTALRKTEADRQKAEAAKAWEEQKRFATELIGLAGPATQAAQAIGGPNGLAGALAAAVVQGQKLAGSWSATESNASGIIGAVGQVAAAVVDGEKEKAAILGVMEGAQALALAFVPGKQAEAAGHAAAALVYGGIAGGLFGGSSGGTATQTGSTMAAQAVGAPVAQGATTTATTIINFNAPLATRYEIGKDVVAAQKAAKAWAKAPAGV